VWGGISFEKVFFELDRMSMWCLGWYVSYLTGCVFNMQDGVCLCVMCGGGVCVVSACLSV
jgi:hypothetical protein